MHSRTGLPQTTQSSVDLREGILYLGEEEIPLQYVPSLGELVCQHCFASISVTVPPFSEMLIPARINPLTASDKWYLLEPSNASLPSEGILVGKTLVDTQHDEVPVRVLNLEQQPRLISKDTLLTSFEPVLSVQSGSLLTHLEKDSHELPVCVKSL